MGPKVPLDSGTVTTTWPLAYWPDGSVKWTGVATVAGPDASGPLRLAAVTDAQASDGKTVELQQSDTTFLIDTGRVRVRIPKIGTNLIDSITIEGREVARAGQLVAIVQDGKVVMERG